MLAKIDDSPQGTEEWLKARIPYVTASEIEAVMAGGSGATRTNLMIKMACEIISGHPTKGFKSKYMQDGNDREATAREVYSLIKNVEVKELGFAYLEDEKLGASTDGLVGDDGLIEIKNVIPAEQVRLLTTGKIKSGYIKQMQTQMYVLDRKWCDFVSQSLGDEDNGELPDRLKIKIIRVERNEDMIAEIRNAVAKFHYELNVMVNKLGEL